MVTSAYDICTRALRLTGVIGNGETADANDLHDTQSAFLSMLDGWKVDNLTIPAVLMFDVPLVAGQQVYTIGPGGDVDTDRPEWLFDASIIYQDGDGGMPQELPLSIRTVAQWQLIVTKAVQSTIPRFLYCDFNFPLANAYLWPVPQTGLSSLRCYLPTPLVDPANLTAQTNFPRGYARALAYNLAVEIAPEFAVNPQQMALVVPKAAEYLADIRRANMKPVVIAADPALRGMGWGHGGYGYGYGWGGLW